MKTKSKNKITKTSGKKIKDTKNSDFPGYPLYAASEDIMNRADRVQADPENPKASVSEIGEKQSESPSIDDDEEIITNNKSELTKDDLDALGSFELETDGGDDEELIKRSQPVDFAGKDLDVPGSEDDDQQESVGSEDEENNTYSIGGEDHQDLEEDKS